MIKKERGSACIFIELTEGNITVYHGESKKQTVLLEIKNASAGSWDKIWKTLTKLAKKHL